ncbi:uncharacterized protein LOC132947088 [Metopolophium dirhodum]|uniref:uncharacterized protein LOC132947088 n=1 Tax=Metopolophium dirhodum TaxID=44670 RepID=UPI0029903958|nr:uncharacterized protein LOC132947088 [Metopolophium dirhodum]
MSNQLPSKSDLTNCSVTSDSNSIGLEPIRNFKWTTRLEKCLLLNMVRLKPSGINKHLSILLLKEKITKELQVNIPIKVLWNYVTAKWDIRAADIIENISFDTSEKDFVLPKEFDQLIAEEGEKMKRLDKERSNYEIKKKILLNCGVKTRSKSNSMSFLDLKDGLNVTIPLTLLESSPAETNEVGSDNVPCTRRLLRTNDKLKNSKLDEKNKLKYSEHLNKTTSNQSKDVEKIEKISNFIGRKRKIRHESESSFFSDNTKQWRNYKNNLTDLTISGYTIIGQTIL